jgi:hypothetical protein
VDGAREAVLARPSFANQNDRNIADGKRGQRREEGREFGSRPKARRHFPEPNALPGRGALRHDADRFTDRQNVACLNHSMFDALTVQIGAVPTAEIAQRNDRTLTIEFCVMSRDG